MPSQSSCSRARSRWSKPIAKRVKSGSGTVLGRALSQTPLRIRPSWRGERVQQGVAAETFDPYHLVARSRPAHDAHPPARDTRHARHEVAHGVVRPVVERRRRHADYHRAVTHRDNLRSARPGLDAHPDLTDLV